MGKPKIAAYGEWESPITTDMMTAASVRLGAVAIDGENIYWLEGRPLEGGRYTLVRRSPDGATHDVTPTPFNVRTRAHEYGGGAFHIADHHIWFTNFDDQRIYHIAPGGQPRAITAAADCRYADLTLDAPRNRLICVRENHEGPGEPVNEIVAVSLEDGSTSVLAGGHDFCSTPALDQEYRMLAWLTWDHPNMPWDETELWVAAIGAGGALEEPRKIAGGYGNSIFQPAWSPSGGLYFVADPRGWWNPYRWDGDRAWCICKKEAEFALPQWLFGMRTYGCDIDGRIITAYCEEGIWRLGMIDPSAGVLERLPVEHTEIADVAVSGREVVFTGSSRHRPEEVVRLNLDTGGKDVLRSSLTAEIDPESISVGRPLEFPTTGGEVAHGFFYPPKSAVFEAPKRTRPPLIVMSHGGPTAATGNGYQLKIQYWTTRGFAVLDVNYRGSTGYGRAYRNLLKGNWGLADVDDCVSGAIFLVGAARADQQRLAIRGGSAGGYCTLAALAFRDYFKAGASYYGVGDLEALVRDTHKFESRYLDGLVGPYPQKRDLYRERSPVHHVGRLSCPVIFFQGLDDKIVPPNQAEEMVAALRAKGLPVAYLAFEGEQHGFRRAETIKRTLEAELYFYGRIFGFNPAGGLDPVDIENL